MNDQGIYYFHQGTNYRAYELLGAHYSKSGTTFRVFAPNALWVSVVGEFNNWDSLVNQMTKISDGGIQAPEKYDASHDGEIERSYLPEMDSSADRCLLSGQKKAVISRYFFG